jgi:hypothetical protein
MKTVSMKLAATCAGVALLLAACGGGSDGGSSTSSTSTTTTTTSPQVAAAQIVGTAATGAAMSFANVSITNSAGTSPCEEASITTSALGSYTCTLKAGQAAPFFIVVTDPTGNTGALVSVTTTTPAAGAALTVNATPLTTAIVAQLASDGNALSVVNGKTVDAAALQAVTTNVLAQLAPVLASIGAGSSYDPFTTSITAATADNTGNTADQVLDIVKIVNDPATGQLALTTVDNPTPVALATATVTGSTVTAPDANVASLAQAAQLVAQKMNGCFAVPTAQRVTGKDTTIPAAQGGPEVNAVDVACQDFVADLGNDAHMDFLHNGYYAGQLFYGLLTSDTMTGAKFSVPEIVAFYPASTSATPPALNAYDRAIVNLRFLDNAGNPGNVVTMAARIPGSSSTARPTEWWLVGNQQTVDISIRTVTRRLEQLNATVTTGGRINTFQAGIIVNVNTKGPGSTSATGNLALARVKGPGLPTAGLVYKVSADTNIATMDLFNATGSLTTGNACGGSTNCPNYWIERTQGLTGSAATTLGTNPGSVVWAQPAAAVNPSLFVKGAQYTVELFYGTNTGTADASVKKTLLADMVRATAAVNLPWNTPGTQTLAALDPAGTLASATSLTVDWLQNLSAPQIGGIVATANSSTGGFGPTKGVPRGATSAVYSPVATFTSGSQRSIILVYRTTDGTSRTAQYAYN